MLKTRVIPCLLYKGAGLVKTVKFKDPKYVGDPINAIRIFNEKEVDELIFLDISASKEDGKPNLEIIRDIASECFMPLCYGGGVRTIEDIRKIFFLGVEKISINTYAIENPDFIKEASEVFGSQSIIVSIDIKKNLLGKYKVFNSSKGKITDIDPVKFGVKIRDMGAGEILINFVDRDGTMQGYDIELIKKFTEILSVPVIALGGAGKMEDFVEVVKKTGVAAVAAGSMFVFHGKYRAVLITYPDYQELERSLQ